LPAEIFSFESVLAIAQTGLRQKAKENLSEETTREDIKRRGMIRSSLRTLGIAKVTLA
jgi:hypothetical protein